MLYIQTVGRMRSRVVDGERFKRNFAIDKITLNKTCVLERLYDDELPIKETEGLILSVRCYNSPLFCFAIKYIEVINKRKDKIIYPTIIKLPLVLL